MRAFVVMLLMMLATAAGSAALAQLKSDMVYVEQGWDQGDREWWYGVSQGSRMLPWSWAQALERPGNTGRFLDPGFLASLGYPANGESVDGLPIGFAIDEVEAPGFFRSVCKFFGLGCGVTLANAPYLGLNCAACHTAQMTYGGKTFEIEGAPTLADFQTLTEVMLDSLKATRASPEAWARFAKAVGGDEADLMAKFDRQLAWYTRLEAKNADTIRYGPGRLDAQGHILNKVSLIAAGDGDQIAGLPSDAPASYPFIWNVPQQDFIQWNGIVKNQMPIRIRGQETDFGALGRNVGEVIGVFGEVDVRSNIRKGYLSSIKVGNLIEIERRLAKLRSPQWPAEFPPIDEDLRVKGEAVFQSAGCKDCHSYLAADDLRSKIKVQMSPIAEQGTDIGLACNTFLHRSRAGLLEGQRSPTSPTLPVPAETETRFLLEAAVVGAILGRADEIASTLVGDVLFGGSRSSIGPRLAIPDAALLPGVTDTEARKRARQCLGGGCQTTSCDTKPGP